MGSALGERATTIVGRRSELDRLGKAMEGLPDQRPCAWFVHGEPGVGKTWLLTEVCRRSAEQGFTVLWGRCVRFGAATSPYAPLVGPIEDWLATADERTRQEVRNELESVIGDSPDASRPGRVLRVVERIFARIETRSPVVLVVDDLQWADATSLDVLAYLVAGFRHQRMAVLVTFRDTALAEGHPLHGWVADLRRLPAVHDLALGRFDESDTEEQLRVLTGRTPSPLLVGEVHARSDGNPYLTELLVRDLPPDAESLPPGLPGELREVLLASWHGLGPHAREVLRLLAVGGRPLPYATFAAVADVLGHDPSTVAAALAEGTRSGVLQVEQGNGYWFRHPLLAEVLVGTLLPGEETGLHAGFVSVLEQLSPRDDAEQMRLLSDLALHHEGSARPDEAFVLTVRAAEYAARLQGYPEQARHLLGAVELLPAVRPAVVEETVGGELALLERAAFACSRSGELTAAHQLVTRGLARVNREQDALLATRLLTEWCRLMWSHRLVERPPLARLLEAVGLSEVAPDSEEHAVALARLAEAECSCGMRTPGEEHARLALAAAERSGSSSAMGVALSVRSLVHLRDASAAADSEAAYAWARRSKDPVVIAEACTARVRCMEEQGRVHDVLAVEAEGCAGATATGARAYQAHFAGQAAMDSLRLGRFTDARTWVREGLAARSIGHGAVQVRRAAAALAIREGRTAEAGEHIERILELSPSFGSNLGGYGPMLLAEYHLALHRPADALAVVERTLEEHVNYRPREADLLLLWASRAVGDLARVGRDAGDRGAGEFARRRLQRLEEARAAAGSDPFRATGPHDRVGPAVGVLLAAERIRADGSSGDVARWTEAVETCDAAGLAWEAAVARRWLAESLLDQGAARAAASRALREAHDVASQMGAVPLREDVETLARAARVDLTRPEDLTDVDDDGSLLSHLTRREREVLAQLVTGRSYAEIAEELFISDKTVSVHVSNILRKTGARNRNEVSALGRRHGVGR
jgi:DNA-binding CsgD family transcriptional regulator